MPTTKPLLLAAFGAALLAAPLQAARAVTLVDGTGRQVEIEDASRLLSLGGSVTETLYALGLADRVVAVDTTSLFPPGVLAEKPNVGYLRALSAEGVLSVGPSLILAEEDAGPPEVVATLEGAAVPFVRVPGEKTAEGIAAKLRLIGAATGRERQADAMAAAVAEDFSALRAVLAKSAAKPVRALFLLSLADGRMMAAGAGTSAEAMMRLAGAENALAGFSGYKPVEPEAVLGAAPEAIVVIARRGNGPGPGLAVEDILANPTLAATPAGRGKRIVAMDGLYLLGFGPRTAHAARDLAAALRPEAALPPLPERPWTAAPAAR